MGLMKSKRERGARGAARRAAAGKRQGRQRLDEVAGLARARVLERLDGQRGALVSALEDAADGLERATRRSSSPLSLHVLGAGGRVLRGASSRLDEHSAEALLARAGQQARQHPGWWVTGLLGAGVLAGRLFRAHGMAEASGGEG
ncbi:hypothetical protein WA016_03404 [Myxococcus stipitatus]